MTGKPQIFISYSHADEAFARELRKLLDRADIRTSGAFDDEVTPGENWAEQLGKSLKASDAMIILLSPETMKSPYTSREVEYALTQERFAEKLIPVIVRPTPPGQIPWILEKFQPIRSRNRADAIRQVVERV